MFVVTLFITAKHRKQYNHVTIGKWLCQTWHVFDVILCIDIIIQITILKKGDMI